MIWENEDWKFVITPRYIRKDKTMIEKLCVHCQGKGEVDDTFDWLPVKCKFCFGTGKQKRLKDIPQPPEINTNFLQDLKNWLDNYKE